MLSANLLGALMLPVADAGDTDVQALRPATPGGPLVWTESVDVEEGPTGSVVLHSARGLLAYTYDDGGLERVVAGLTRADLLGGWGLGRVQVGVGVPLLLRVTSDTLDNQTGLGDLTLNGRVAVLRDSDGPVGVGAVGRLTLPTTTATGPVGGGGVGFEGRAAAETGTDAVRILANLGLRLAPGSENSKLPVGSSLVSGAGVAWAATPNGGVTGEIALSPVLGLSDLTNRTPAELLGGGWVNVSDDWRVNLGGGVGLGEGVGAPAWRLYVAFASRTDRSGDGDLDDDGIMDSVDLCPFEAETINGVRDADGCPEDPTVVDADRDQAESLELESNHDRDEDGIIDRQDACPDEPEDADGFEDADGCPEYDVDEDGIADSVDKCPLTAETANGVDDDDGCPEAVSEEVAAVAGVVRGITFRSGEDALESSSLPVLEKVFLVLKDNPTWRAAIEGHTDDVGDRARSQDLSARRAATVKRWLVGRGINAHRLEAAGKGPDAPLDTNETDAGRARNRCVEIAYSSQEAP